MRPKRFIEYLESHRIVEAIRSAEARSSGEIRVFVSHRKRHDALQAARERFEKLGMTRTAQRNAVLLYFAPVTQQFAVWGDLAIHEKCGETFWYAIVEGMTPMLKSGQFTDAIIFAVEKIGVVLAEHFPRRPDDRNELPDQVEQD